MPDFDWPLDPEPSKRAVLRGRQPEMVEKTYEDIATGFTRMLFCAAGGFGKTVCLGEIAYREWTQRGIRSLVTVNRKSIVKQTARRIAEESGLECSVEMGDEHASPYSPCVVASVQSLSKITRLTGFSDTHFGYVFPDEAHFSVAPGSLRINNYFHYGAESLAEGWKKPDDGTYAAKARVVGFTATPEEKLMEWYQHITVKYPYFQAVKDGVLVPVIQKSIPVKIDLRKRKIVGTDHGRDFKESDLTETLVPVIEELADQVLLQASDRKTIAFLPSVQTARMMAEALCRRGLKAIFVSGECPDIEAKEAAFRAGGMGSVACCAQLWGYGIDFVDVNCVAWFRATISRSFALQGWFRASRVLPGVIDGIEDPELRRAAIAASDKPNFLLLDPLFVTERADLCCAYDLYTDEPEVKEKMKQDGVLTPEAAEKAERDFVKALNKAARKVQHRNARVVDPLSWGVTIGLERLKDYQPETDAEARPISAEQTAFLQKHHVSLEGIKCRGAASLVIGTYLKRLSLRLATPEQLTFMKNLGLDTSPTISRVEASKMISSKLGRA